MGTGRDREDRTTSACHDDRTADHGERPPPDLTSAVEAAAEALVMVWSRAREGLVPRVSPSQLRALVAVERHGVINLGGLAEELGAIPSSATRLCDRLEAAGLLARDVGIADRREVMVSLTADGEQLLRSLRERRQADLGQVLARMSPAARTALLIGLEEFQAATAEEPPAKYA